MKIVIENENERLMVAEALCDSLKQTRQNLGCYMKANCRCIFCMAHGAAEDARDACRKIVEAM